MPEVPARRESSDLVLSAPKGTPPEVVRKIAAAAEQSVKTPSIQATGKKRYMGMTPHGPERTVARMKTGYDYLMQMIETAK